MWIYNSIRKEIEILNSDRMIYNQAYIPLSRFNNYNVVYMFGEIKHCTLGISNDYPCFDGRPEVIKGKVNKIGKFGFVFSGKNIENEQPFNEIYLGSNSEIFVYYNNNFIDPCFLNNNVKCYCLIRCSERKNKKNPFKVYYYPEIIYPIYLKEELIDQYLLTENKMSAINKFVPYYNKKPQMKWTK